MDIVSFGSGRRRKRWLRGWPPRRGRPRRWAWLAVLAVLAAAVAAVVVVSPAGHAPHTARVSLPSAQALPPFFAGVPVRAAHTDLFLGGENFLRVGRRPLSILPSLLHNGLSPLLPNDHGAEVDQLLPVPGGVVAHISDISTGVTYGARGRVVFIPAADAPARVIAWATMIAVAPGGRQVWVQTAVQAGHNGAGVPATFKSPTWAVSLVGKRVSPVLRLPLGLVGATDSGPLTQNLDTGELQLWSGRTGRALPLPLPGDANFVAAGGGRVIWQSCASSCALHVTDLSAGTDVAMRLPRHWGAVSGAYPPPPASFDASGLRFVVPLEQVDHSGTVIAEDLFVADTATRRLRMILSIPGAVAAGASGNGIQLVGSWDRAGVLWVLAMSPDNGYYQLGFWTGAGPVRTFAPAEGVPMVLSAPGSG